MSAPAMGGTTEGGGALPGHRPHVTHADLGGQRRAERIVPEPEGVRFHAPWERDVLALVLAMGATGAWNLDASRDTREQLPDYDTLGYYGIWFEALRELALSRGLVTSQELEESRAIEPPRPLPRVLRGDEVAAVLRRGWPTQRPATSPARFAVGDAVLTRRDPAPHHTRLPGYARGRVGVVERIHGTHVLPDTNARGLGEHPQWLYGVRFDGAALWGADGSAAHVSLDLWESYLEPAPAVPPTAPGVSRGSAA